MSCRRKIPWPPQRRCPVSAAEVPMTSHSGLGAGVHLASAVLVISFLLLFSHQVMSNSVTAWTAAPQASLSITVSQSLPEFMSIESVIRSNHLNLCHPFLFLPSIFPSIRVFSNDLAVRTRWPKYWSFSFSISPSNDYSGLTTFKIGSHRLPGSQVISPGHSDPARGTQHGAPTHQFIWAGLRLKDA